MKAGGFTWDLTAGDTGTPPFVPDFGFSNLHAPMLTFAGASVSATSPRVTVRAAGGRTTQTRNIFGTDLRRSRQTRVPGRRDGSLITSTSTSPPGAHGSTTATWDRTRPSSTGRKTSGAGLVLKPTSYWRITADVGVSRFERRGRRCTETSPSWLVGSLAGRRTRPPRGQRAAVLGRPLRRDELPLQRPPGRVRRRANWVVTQALRLFGGADMLAPNLDPKRAGATVAMPDGMQTRGFGGVRLQWAQALDLHASAPKAADARSSPSRFTPGFETDTGALTAEWQGHLPKATLFTRYERRTNVDANYAPEQLPPARGLEPGVLPPAERTRTLRAGLHDPPRRTAWAAARPTGTSAPGCSSPSRGLQLRLEGTVGRTDDWETRRPATAR